MPSEELLAKICRSAVRCRQLAEQASDPEAAEALHDMASEFEAAESILRQYSSQPTRH